MAFTDALSIALIRSQNAAIFWIRLGIDPRALQNNIGATFAARAAGSALSGASEESYFDALAVAVAGHGASRISIPDLLLALFDIHPEMARSMLQHAVRRSDIEMLARWHEANVAFQARQKKFWSRDNQLRKPALGVSWAYGYTATLSKYSFDLTSNFENSRATTHLIGRDNEVEQIERILSRAGENNVLLVGEPGVGKKTIVYSITEMIARGLSVPLLAQKRVLELNANDLIGSQGQELESLVSRVLADAARAGNIVLFIDQFQNLLRTDGAGTENISEVLKPFLASSRFQVIASTDTASYHDIVERRSDVLALFEKVDVLEPDADQTLQIFRVAAPRASHLR